MGKSLPQVSRTMTSEGTASKRRLATGERGRHHLNSKRPPRSGPAEENQMELKNLLTWAGAATLIVATCTAAPRGQSCCPGVRGQAGSTAQPTVVKGVQKATVMINGGYSPSVVRVVAGKPVELTFSRTEKSGCGGEVVIKGLKYDKEGASGKSIVVRFTPKTAGEIPFTCGMGMLSGKIVVTRAK